MKFGDFLILITSYIMIHNTTVSLSMHYTELKLYANIYHHAFEHQIDC
jgi:hypothetical protein